MGFLDRLLKRKPVQADQSPQIEPKPAPPVAVRTEPAEHKKYVLSFEGTRFPLFTQQAAFIEECRRSGLAALFLSFTEFWPTYGRAQQANAFQGGVRLLCSNCIVDMADSFRFSLPGGLGSILGGIVAVGDGLPSNLPEAAKSAQCPYCGSGDGILLCDGPDYGEITGQDMDALRELWRSRSTSWWSRKERPEVICDGYQCSSHIPRGEGYYRGFDMICEECARKATASEKLPDLRKNPDYFGTSELRRARNFKLGLWRFERGEILEA